MTRLRLARFPLVLTLLIQSGFAQIGRPRLGQMIDSGGLLRPVFGVGGSFTVEGAEARGILATACGATLCLAKTGSALLSVSTSGGARYSGVTPAPPGPAMIAVDGDGAALYFPETNQFAAWSGGALTPLPIQVDGEVLALRRGPGGLEIAVRRSGFVQIVSQAGGVLDSLPQEAVAVFLLPEAIVYSTSDELVLRRADQGDKRFGVSGVSALYGLGEGYVAAEAGPAVYALRTTPGREALFLLPRPPAPVRGRVSGRGREARP